MSKKNKHNIGIVVIKYLKTGTTRYRFVVELCSGRNTMEGALVSSRPEGGNKPDMYAGRISKTGEESRSQTGYFRG